MPGKSDNNEINQQIEQSASHRRARVHHVIVGLAAVLGEPLKVDRPRQAHQQERKQIQTEHHVDGAIFRHFKKLNAHEAKQNGKRGVRGGDEIPKGAIAREA